MSDGVGLFAVKMRASLSGRHISGAERIVPASAAPRMAAALAERAVSHPLGAPDSINLKIQPVSGAVRLRALEVVEERTDDSPAGGRSRMAELLKSAGIPRAAEILELFQRSHSMRGAMIVDADTLERLDGGGDRGVRATNMDWAGNSADGAALLSASKKDHFGEALVLATKVANAPGIVGEICVSDDPDYTTGYVASLSLGYRRIKRVKEKGDPRGGRIFIYRGPREGVASAVEWLEKKCVLVEGKRPAPAAAREDPLASMRRELDEAARAGLYRRCRVLRPLDGAAAETAEGVRAVVLSSNDYLGLASDPRLAEAAARAAREWGAGSGGSRLTTGTRPVHAELERRIAAFKGAEDAVLYATGYMANIGVVQSVAGKGDIVFSDELNHASIIDGCRLSGAKIAVYPHRDMDAFGSMARDALASGGYRRAVAVTDGVFSMDGDIVDLPAFLETCKSLGILSIVDEAHATGVAGKTGRGLCERFSCGLPDIVVGTFSKALGSEGGFAATSRTVAEYLRNKSRSFIFSTAPSPATAAASLAALTILEEEPWRVETLRSRVEHFISRLGAAGLEVSTQSAIVPVPVGGEQAALDMASRLEKEGFWIPAVRYPTVAKGKARLRAAISAALSPGELSLAASAIAANHPSRAKR